MADNVTLNPGAGGSTVSTEDIGAGIQMERTKIVTGAHGTDGGDVTVSNPFPVAGTVAQGAPGASAWPVDIQGGTVSVSNLQQLSVVTKLSVDNYDLSAAAYSQGVPFATDSLLAALELRFSTTASRNITLTHNDGTILYTLTGSTNLSVEVDFEDYAIDAGSTLTLSISQTGGACLVDITFTAKVGTAALGGNPVLGAGTSHIGEVGLDVIDSPAGDAFGRLRVSQPTALIDSVHQYNASPLQWGTIIAGGGTITHRPFLSSVELGCTTTSGDSIKFQTKKYLRYQPGKSNLILASFIMGTAKANVRRRVGYFDDDDGIFIEQNGTTDLAIVRRTSTSGSPVDNRVVQSAWNLDPFDGTGPSGVVLDLSKDNLLVIDFQWLSVGRVRIGFDINGRIYYVHAFNNANVLPVPYMKTANLPVRYEMTNTGTAASASTLFAICATVSAEGGHEELGYVRSVNTGITAEAVTAAEVVLAIRPKLTFNSISNRGHIQPVGIDLLSNADLRWEIFYDPTLTSPSWVSAGANSIVEYDVSASAFSGGDLVASGYKGTGSGIIATSVDLEKVGLNLDPDGTASDILALVITSLGGSANVWASMQWRERY